MKGNGAARKRRSIRAERPRRGNIRTWPCFCPSIFTGQVNDVVGEVELRGVERKISVRDLFAKDHVSVAVVTGEGSGFVGPDVECPDRNSSAATFWSWG